MADRRRDIRICLVLFLFLSLAFAGISEARNKMDERQVFSSLGLMIPGEDSENKVVPKYRDLAYGLPETPLIPYTKQQEQLENKGIRIIVSLKDPIEVDGWGKRIHSLDKSQIRYLEKNMMEYVIKETGKNSVKHRYSSFNGFSVIVPREKIPELERNGLVKWIEYDMPMQVMLEDTVELINADEAWGFKDANGAGLTGKGQAVCVVDTGVDYTHPDLGGCEIEYVNGTAKNRVVESDHPYDNNFSHVWTITESGFDGIAVHFKNISVEGYFDKIYIKDGGGTTVETWTGSYEDVWSVSVPGDTIKINLVTDYSITDYGFYIDKVLNGSVEKPYWSNCSKVIGGYDFYNLDSDPMDDHSHGTHCAGIVAANGNIKGVAPGANIVAVKVLSAYGSGAESDVVAGIEYCNNHSDEYNISVISMSLGSGSLYSSYCDSAYLSFSLAINQSFNKNISVVIASGNSGDCSEISAPACIETAVPIASTTKSEEISYFSNRNQLVQLMAPGSDINSTVLGGAYAVHSGTSMATPHAAGAFAIYHQKLESKGISSTPWQVEEDFHSTGKTIQDTCSGRSYSRIDLTFLGKNTSLTKTLSDNLIGLENNEKALFEMEIKELGGNDLTNHRLIDEYNTSILNYSNAIPEPDTVNLSTGKVEWVINLSPGSSQTIRLNLTPTKIGETINWVYLINQSGTELMNDSVDLTIIQHDYCGEKIKNTLNLTSNLVCARNGLEVDKNNLVIDCQGHTISGASPESNYGIMLEQVQNITLKNCDLKDFNCGISLNYSTENRVLDNTISYTEIGILADSSNNNNISGNNLDSNFVYGIVLDHSDHNNILKNNESENGESGILLSSSNNNTIVNNTINSNRMIYWFFEIGFGIAISDSSSNLISGNEMLNNSIAALYLDNSSENIVSSNRMMENPYGVAIGSEAEDNLLLSNQITNCSYCTIYDFTAPSHINYLAYNNSYGSIKWADKTFLGNLTIMKGSLTFPGSVVIGNGFAYFDPSNFTGGIDSSANVTLDLQYKHIFKPLILRDGELCSECIPLGFEDEVIEFTVPSWSNYSVVNNGTRCDLNGDGIVDMPELMTYTARWKTDDGVTRQEVEEARDIWFRGGGYGG